MIHEVVHKPEPISTRALPLPVILVSPYFPETFS
ncbi:MAG: hypothetical protein JWM16_2583 [Verrucomicrobiales bacterium]|nr:hypothetical protein [Verrucomicrobiales bacterium]